MVHAKLSPNIIYLKLWFVYPWIESNSNHIENKDLIKKFKIFVFCF